MLPYRFSSIATAFCFGLFFLGLPFSVGQDVPAAEKKPAAENASEPEQAEPLQIKLSVNEVRLDVAVLDRKGNPITDLTARDFEVFQDGKRQKVLSGVYIDSQSDAAARPAHDRNELPNLPSQPATELKKEDVRRTIMFVADDFAMNFENGYNTKMALRNFVEKQMQPGDLVSILRTDYGNSALNMFFSDKREALARINAMPATKAQLPTDLFSGFGNVYSKLNPIYQEANRDFVRRLYESQMTVLAYSLRALKNMPGRKILIMMIPQSIYEEVNLEGASRYLALYNRLADEALRAGVVINLLDMDGLHNKQSSLDVEGLKRARDISPEEFLILLRSQTATRLTDPFTPLNPMPDKTGGVVIKNSNFFLEGIGKETESLMRGYYLISYEPPPDTFGASGRKDDYRRLKVRVKRSGAKVYTRDGFFGRLESEATADTQKQNPLMETIYSPFQSAELNVDIASGYVKDGKSGYFVRSWIHIDPRDVKITETEDGRARIDLEAVCVTSDINGNIADSKRMEFSLTGFNVNWVQKHGIRFSMLLPVKNPGSYYIRISVQDRESGKIGSAYQFLEIPDLKKKGLALSNIFMITSAEDMQWMNSKEDAEEVFSPVFQEEEVSSPALRTYKSGDNLQMLAMLYNADAKAIERSEIEIQTILYKDGKEWMRSEPKPVARNKEEDTDSILIVNRLTLRTPGDYVMQLLATDKKNSKGNESAASQTLSFTIV